MAGKKIPAGILGATGVVGQRFVQLLENHPWFEIAWLAASDRYARLEYAAAARWRLRTAIPSNLESMRLASAQPAGAPNLILSALDAAVAAALEPRFPAAGHAVVSNASAFRMQPARPRDWRGQLACRARRERALPPRSGRRWAHGISLGEAAQAGDARADHRGIPRF